MATLPSRDYWTRRSEEALLMGEKDVLTYEKELKQAYEATSENLKKELEAFYGRYATKEGIPLSKAREKLSPTATMSFKKRQEQYLAQIENLGDDAFTEPYKTKLRRMSARAYVTKLDEIESNIRHHIETLSTKYHQGTKSLLETTYEDGFYGKMFDIQKQAGFGVDFTALGDKQLQAAVNQKWNGANYSDRIWNNKETLINNLQRTVQQEFVRGRGLQQVSQDFAHQMDVSYSNAQRLIRTEFNHISNQGTLNAYKESGVVEEYEFLATLDSRTSAICQDLDGKTFKLSEAATGINMPPMHPHCRSTTIPYFPDDELEDTQRIARAKDGSTYLVDGEMNYKQWAEEHAEDAYVRKLRTNSMKYAALNAAVAPKTEPAPRTEKVPAFGETPKTLENYDKHAEDYYEKYKHNFDLLSEQQKTDANKVLKELIDNNDFCMRIPNDTILNKILDDDRFKTQFETGTSSGALSGDARTEATRKLFGIDTNKLKAADYEKYGYLGSKNMAQELRDNHRVGQYGGNISITFKRENVIDRTTFTMEDSLGPALNERIIASKVNNPNIIGSKRTALEDLWGDEDFSLKQDILDNMNDPNKAVKSWSQYVELQYHGDLITADIGRVTAIKGALTDTTIERLKKLGVEVEIVNR